MKVMGGITKGIAALAIVFYTYVNHNLSPLFWVLLGLIAADLLLNLRDESKQLQKLGSTFFAVAAPVMSNSVGNHLFSPDMMKVMVALLTLAYIQIVFPQVFAFIKKLSQGKTPIISTTEAQIAQMVANEVEAALQSKAQTQAGQATTPISQAGTEGK